MSSNKEKIIAAAEKLEAEGVNPTQVTVREALGGGSFATIGPVLKEWKESKKEDHALTEIQVPEAITERLEQLQGAVWQAAVDEAERRLNAEREALKAAQDKAAGEVAEHLDIIKALEVEAEDYQRKIETLEEVSNSLDADRHNALTELAQVKAQTETERHAAAEAIIKETERREAAEARAERAEALHREAIEQARSDQAALRAEHKTELEAVKREAAELAQVQTNRAEKAEKEAQQRGAGEQACQSRLEAAQREAEQTQKRLAALEEKASKAVQEAAELRGELKAMKQS
jgi:chromosome segregation ATPase